MTTSPTESARKKIAEKLRNFGCTERESSIYLESLRLGPSSVQELSRALGFNRVTVHSAVESLLARGVLSESRRGKRRIVAAEPPSIFGRLIQKQESELRALKGELSEIEELFTHLPRRSESVPTVRFLEEVDGFKRMLEETLSARGEVLVFSYVDLFSKLVNPNYLEDYFARRSAKGIHTRLIFPPCLFASRVQKKAEDYRIKIRLLPAEMKWSAGIFAWNTSLALLSFTQGKITCTIVENEDLAYFYRGIIFELAWKQAKPFSEK